MGKIKFMAEEFFRSFRKNLFKNVLLMAMFSTSMVMTVLMGSYYLDLEEQHPEMPSYKENGTWYRIGLLEDTMEMEGSIDTVQGCQKIMEYYERLHDSEEHPIFSVDTVNDCYVKEDDLRDLFGKTGCDSFVSENNPGAITAYFGAEDEGSMCSILALKCAMLDDTAFEIFGLRTEEGEGFSKNNLTLQNASDPVPVLLGHEYKGILSVGSQIQDVALRMIDEMMSDEMELISIYYGSDISEDDAEALRNEVEKKYGGCDIELQYGGQPIYYYTVSVE